MEKLSRVVSFLDKELKIDEFEDSSNNGLQVECLEQIGKICLGVDASMEMLEESVQRGADMVVCHHGLSWGDSLKRITGQNYRKVAFLINNGMALYGCHLPLDAHPKYGNNAVMCKELGLRNLRAFGAYADRQIGFVGELPKPISYNAFKKRILRVTGRDGLQSMDFGKQRIRRVAVVSGGAADLVIEAGEKGIDLYISGEPKLMAYCAAQEYEINAVFAGHYATEVFGVKALAALLARRMKVKTEFVDLKIPY